MQENLTGVRVVKAFARQAFEEEKFEGANFDKLRLGKRLLLMHSLYWPLSDLLCGIQMLAGYTVGALMAINGTISVGTYLAYAGMLLAIIWPMRNLGRLVVEMSRGLVSFDRVSEIIRQDREVMTEPGFKAPTRLEGNLSFDNVSFVYGTAASKVAATLPTTAALHTNGSSTNGSNGHNGASKTKSDKMKDISKSENSKMKGKVFSTNEQATSGQSVIDGEQPTEAKAKHHAVALQEISFNVKPGQRVALLGTAGAGKTTLVNLLPRFYDYTGGHILLDGVELKEYSREYLAPTDRDCRARTFSLFAHSAREHHL